MRFTIFKRMRQIFPTSSNVQTGMHMELLEVPTIPRPHPFSSMRDTQSFHRVIGYLPVHVRAILSAIINASGSIS